MPPSADSTMGGISQAAAANVSSMRTRMSTSRMATSRTGMRTPGMTPVRGRGGGGMGMGGSLTSLKSEQVVQLFTKPLSANDSYPTTTHALHANGLDLLAMTDPASLSTADRLICLTRHPATLTPAHAHGRRGRGFQQMGYMDDQFSMRRTGPWLREESRARPRRSVFGRTDAYRSSFAHDCVQT